LMRLTLDEYIEARDGLLQKFCADLQICFFHQTSYIIILTSTVCD
jgi:hypothetical protein